MTVNPPSLSVAVFSLFSFLLLAEVLAVTYPAINETNFPSGSISDAQSANPLLYRYFVPVNYDAQDSETLYPLVIYLHGNGSPGSDNEQQLTSAGRTHHIFLSSNAPNNQQEHPCFYVAPQRHTSTGSWDNEDASRLTAALIEHFIDTYPVDPDRVYITGVSGGGAGTMQIVSLYPQYFAAAAPLCGWTSGIDPAGYAHIPTWIFHAANDNTVNVNGSDTIASQLRGAGGHPIYTRYNTGGHSVWTKAYHSSSPLVDWMMAQRRGQEPASVDGSLIKILTPTEESTHDTSRLNVEISGVAHSGVTSITYENEALGNLPEVTGLENWSVSTGLLSSTQNNRIILSAEAISYGSGTTNGSTTLSTEINISLTNPNQAPEVEAGSSQTLYTETGEVSVNLSGVVTDDNLPADGVLSTQWTLVEGPQSAQIGTPSALSTTVQFESVGIYVFRLTADDDDAVVSDDVTIAILPTGFPNTVRFDFGQGSRTTSGNWNNLSDPSLGTTVSNAIDINGNTTEVQLSVTDDFNGSNGSGIAVDVLYPSTAARDSFYINVGELGQVELSGLDPDLNYKLTCFASRSATNDRTSAYTIGSEVRLLNAASNETKVATFSSITPDSSGKITMDVEANEGAVYGYLGVLELTPIPASTPTAEDLTVTTQQGVPVDITLEGTAYGSQNPQFILATLPQNGVLSGTAPDLTYVPNNDYMGADQFTYSVSNGDISSTIATVNITVTELLVPTVLPLGDGTGYDLSVTGGNALEVSGFRSSGVAKSLDLDQDHVYGSAGYFFYGNGSNNSSNVQELPSWVSNLTPSSDTVVVLAGYTDFDNPTLPVTNTVVDWTSTGIGNTRNDTAEAWAELVNFSITSSSPKNFRLGILAGNEGNADGRWDSVAFRLVYEGEILGSVTDLGTSLGLVFFDVTLPDGFEGTLSVEGQTRNVGSNSRGSSLAGILFDEPLSTYEAWLTSYGVSDVTIDSDTDGIPNLLEFVLNGDPSLHDVESVLPKVLSAAGSHHYTFYRRKDSVPVTTQTIQYSHDLDLWLDLPADAATSGVEVTDHPNNSELEQVSLELNTLSSETQVFLKLIVTP